MERLWQSWDTLGSCASHLRKLHSLLFSGTARWLQFLTTTFAPRDPGEDKPDPLQVRLLLVALQVACICVAVLSGSWLSGSELPDSLTLQTLPGFLDTPDVLTAFPSLIFFPLPACFSASLQWQVFPHSCISVNHPLTRETSCFLSPVNHQSPASIHCETHDLAAVLFMTLSSLEDSELR